ncbi:MAG: TauD/TfdA family dioxygenase, partial [Myxococcota bacterium]
AVKDLDLCTWASDSRALLIDHLHRHGALLFRGFALSDPADLARLTDALTSAPLPYVERSSPRSEVGTAGGNIYTSTDYPPDQPIFLHNEQSYNLSFPRYIFFHCLTAAQSGGETPLADTRDIYRRIPPDLRLQLCQRKYMYIRNYDARFGLTWQEAFQTHTRAEVETYCQANQITCTWIGEDHLRTRQIREFAAYHPATGQPVWFNHAVFFNSATLPPELLTSLAADLQPEELPSNTFYGDGEPIESEVIATLQDAYRQGSVSEPWSAGDVIMVDNMLSSHGRNPFVGERRILAAMATAHSWHDLALVAPTELGRP